MARIEIDFTSYGHRTVIEAATPEAAIKAVQTMLRGMDWQDASKITLRIGRGGAILNERGEVVGTVLETGEAI